jgi:asparagine synthase (glutamine-hydrolysing)
LAYAKLFEQARKDNVLVLLDGQGMDEQWNGYDYYTQENDATIQGLWIHHSKEYAFGFFYESRKNVISKPFADAVLNKQ